MLFINKNKKYKELILKAKQYFQEDDLKESVKYFEEAFKIKALLADYIMYGYILIDLFEYNKAEILFNNMLEKIDLPEVNFALANIYERTNRQILALEKYEKVVEKSPDFEPAHFSLAYIYDDISEENKEDLNGENSLKAIKHYEVAIKLNDKNFWSFLNLGSIYERHNMNEKALDYFLKAYEIDNNKSMICYNIGVTYYKLKKYEQALEFYNKELEQENPFKSTFYNLGILYKEGFKDYDKSKYYYLKGLENNEEDYNIWYNLGCIHALLQDYQNAYDCFKYIYYKKKEYLNYLDEDQELNEFRQTSYYKQLKIGIN